MKPKGRHPDRALTAVKIRTLKQPGRYADGNGLYLIVDPSGASRWMLRTVVQGRRRDIGLGSARLVSLADAREAAREYRHIARSGGDPVAESRKARRVLPTFAHAARVVHAEHAQAWKNTKHSAQWLTTLDEYAFPIIGERKIDQIDTPDILRVLAPIWLTKSETARRLKQRIRAVLDWAKASGFRLGDNPVDGVEKGLPRQSDKVSHHAALPYIEIPSFILSIRDSTLGEPTRLAFELLVLTASRTSEVLCALWQEIDFHNKIWTIPPSRMKAGREHRVPLSSRCIEIFRRAKELTGDSDLVFPGRKSGEPMTNMVFLMALRRMELSVTTHGFRSAFRDWAAERTNFPRDVCEMALAHTIKDKVEAAYRRGDLFEKRLALMDSWSSFATSNSKKIVRLHTG